MGYIEDYLSSTPLVYINSGYIEAWLNEKMSCPITFIVSRLDCIYELN